MTDPQTPDELWGEDVARRYDASLGDRGSPEAIDPVVEFLVELADGGRALEFAIGTGRIGLPLAAAGVQVHGIELSEPMVAELQAKPGGDAVPVTIGDMATTRVEGEYSLVYLVFNTITNLLTQAEQVACFRNAAAHLRPGGHFVIETGVPRLQRLPPGERFIPFDVSDDHIGVDEYDVANQRSVSHHVYVIDGEVQTVRSPHRWAWPAEYDLMAEMAGMTLAARWADWHRRPFDADSRSHISAWRRM